jgi:hypothetical protein
MKVLTLLVFQFADRTVKIYPSKDTVSLGEIPKRKVEVLEVPQS